MTTIKQSRILAYVAENRALFPLPAGAGIEPDLDPLIPFDPEEFTSTSKATFAREWAVQNGQVGRWVKSGMPCLPDGRIPRSAANGWLRANRAEWIERKLASDEAKLAPKEPEDSAE